VNIPPCSIFPPCVIPALFPLLSSFSLFEDWACQSSIQNIQKNRDGSGQGDIQKAPPGVSGTDAREGGKAIKRRLEIQGLDDLNDFQNREMQNQHGEGLLACHLQNGADHGDLLQEPGHAVQPAPASEGTAEHI